MKSSQFNCKREDTQKSKPWEIWWFPQSLAHNSCQAQICGELINSKTRASSSLPRDHALKYDTRTSLLNKKKKTQIARWSSLFFSWCFTFCEFTNFKNKLNGTLWRTYRVLPLRIYLWNVEVNILQFAGRTLAQNSFFLKKEKQVRNYETEKELCPLGSPHRNRRSSYINSYFAYTKTLTLIFKRIHGSVRLPLWLSW